VTEGQRPLKTRVRTPGRSTDLPSANTLRNACDFQPRNSLKPNIQLRSHPSTLSVWNRATPASAVLITGILAHEKFASHAYGSASRGCAFANRRRQDVVKVSPETHKVLLENVRIRVLDVHVKPGEHVAMHSHPAGILYFSK
jgi:hypothetical protein